ncbi:MAG: hypothetical protein LC107_10070 [Chitinophagales bacterium]|nr:hypothetical protein [Chitinophagales bacterium]
MENWNEKLEIISGKVRNLLDAFHRLQSENSSQKEEINRLKVEIDQIRAQKNNINSEQTNQVTTVIEQSANRSDDTTGVQHHSDFKNQKNDHVKTQLDEIIEDLDRCIQIIQTNANGKQ